MLFGDPETARWRRAFVLAAAVPTLVWWIERVVALPSSGWFAGETTFAIGGDFRTFHTAAVLTVEGRGGVLYDPEVFLSALGTNGPPFGPLGNPPPAVLLLAPLGWLSFEAAWVVWSLLTLLAIAVALRAIGVRRWVSVGLAMLLFPPVYYTITFGQLGALWIVIYAVSYFLLRRGALVPAGAVAGLLVMKPTLAVGFALWWLVEWRRYWKAAVASLAAALGLLALSYAVLPEIWTGYTESLGAFVELREEVATQWAQFSLWAFWDLLLPDSRPVATGLGVASSAAVMGIAIGMLRRSVTLEQKFAIAVLVTALVPPHLLAYDWILLIIPGVLLCDGTTRYVASASAVTLVTALSIVLTRHFLDTAGYAFQLAPLVLLAAIAVERNTLGYRGRLSRTAA